MSLTELQNYTFTAKYARYNKEEKRRETWDEAVNRVRDMHLSKYPEITDDINWAFEMVRQKRVLGSQRCLQFGGKPILDKNARTYNCWNTHINRPRVFQEAFWLLLCGGGVGFSVQKHHVKQLPDFYPRRKWGSEEEPSLRTPPTKTFVVPDTIEGWADALGVLIATYMPFEGLEEWEGFRVVFDYKEIREEGSPLSGGFGKAPGPQPLAKALEAIRDLLDRSVAANSRLQPIDAYDILMHASDAVLSGGVRRSASICLFSLDDEDMVTAKTGNWFTENPQRGRSNNSAVLLRDEVTYEEFEGLIDSVRQFGEPGFYWVDDTEVGTNPCCEIGMYPVTEDGDSGWQACNLCEINGRKVTTRDEFLEACRAAAIIGTLQAGYTEFDYLGHATERIVSREALLGVSITGFQDNPQVLLDDDIQREGALEVRAVNERVAKQIGINPAARTTCVKPAGTTSLVLGTASGIHPHHARRYFRRIQANALEPVYKFFAERNPRAVEKSVWSANKTDKVITFCVDLATDDRSGAITKNDLSALELLECVKKTQLNWVSEGTSPTNAVKPFLRHNVSNTINVREDEWEDVTKFIYENRRFFGGVSLLPHSGDLDYPQAPMCNVLTPREIYREYGDCSLLASGLIVDGIKTYGDLWVACDSVMRDEPTDWARRVKQFAERYMDGDVRKVTYLLKHVSNWKLWMDLKREFKSVDYSELREDTDDTKPLQTVACGGGGCDLV